MIVIGEKSLNSLEESEEAADVERLKLPFAGGRANLVVRCLGGESGAWPLRSGRRLHSSALCQGALGGKKEIKVSFQAFKWENTAVTARTRSDSLAEILAETPFFAVTGLFRTLAPMGAATGAGERARSRKESWRGFTSI